MTILQLNRDIKAIWRTYLEKKICGERQLREWRLDEGIREFNRLAGAFEGLETLNFKSILIMMKLAFFFQVSGQASELNYNLIERLQKTKNENIT